MVDDNTHDDADESKRTHVVGDVSKRTLSLRSRGDTNTIGVPPGTRLQRIIRLSTGWLQWLATSNYIHGTYIVLYDDGRIIHVVCRVDEGDEFMQVRPADKGA